jgi:hypothetical protein
MKNPDAVTHMRILRHARAKYGTGEDYSTMNDNGASDSMEFPEISVDDDG